MKTFTVEYSNISGRLDPQFYNPNVAEIENKLKAKFGEHKFDEVIEDIYRYPTFYGFRYQNVGIPIIKGENIDEFGLIDENQEFDYITTEIHNKFYRTKLEKNDLLFTVRGIIGKVGLFNGFVPEANINANLIKITIKKEHNPKFFWIYLNSELGQTIIQNMTSGQVQKTITVPDIRNISIPLLPIESENEIVEKIESAYFTKRQKEAEAKELLDSIDNFVLDALGITYPKLQDQKCYSVVSKETKDNRIDPQYHQPKFRILLEALKQSKYPVRRLKEFIITIHYGASVGNEYVDDGIPLLRIQNLQPNRIDFEHVVRLPDSIRKEIGKAFVLKDDLLISRSGTIGVVSVVPKEAEGYAFGSFMIKFTLNDQIDKNYVSIWLNTEFARLLTGRERIGAIQGNITIPAIEYFRIPFPPIEIQMGITTEVKSRMNRAEKLYREAEKVVNRAKAEVEKMILG